MSKLQAIRERLDWTQAEMADALGLSLRAYHGIEAGEAKERESYVLAAEYIALREGVRRGDITVPTRNTMMLVADMWRELTGQPNLAAVVAERVLDAENQRRRGSARRVP